MNSKLLREYSRTIAGKQQLIINSFSKALEVIPRQLEENAGIDSVDILNKLRKDHADLSDQNNKWMELMCLIMIFVTHLMEGYGIQNLIN